MVYYSPRLVFFVVSRACISLILESGDRRIDPPPLKYLQSLSLMCSGLCASIIHSNSNRHAYVLPPLADDRVLLNTGGRCQGVVTGNAMGTFVIWLLCSVLVDVAPVVPNTKTDARLVILLHSTTAADPSRPPPPP